MRIGCDDCCADGESTASNHEIGQGQDGPHLVVLDELLEERHIARVVDRGRRAPDIRRVLGGRERVGIGGHDEGVLSERADDVVALADAGKQDCYAVAAGRPRVVLAIQRVPSAFSQPLGVPALSQSQRPAASDAVSST